MPKGGRRSTTWTPTWKSGKTTVIRVPEALEERLIEIARVLDKGEELPVTGNKTTDEVSLKERADTFLLTIPPKERLKAKRLLYGFIRAYRVGCSESGA